MKANANLPAKHEREAARKYLEHDYAAHHLGGHAAREADRNATAIDEEHPRARDIALTGTARELGELPRHLKRHQSESRRLAGIDTEEARRIRNEYRSHGDQEDEPRSEPRAARARETAGAAAGLARTGYETASDTSAGELIGQVILGGIGLSIFYLFLSRAAAASKLALGATQVVRAVISPAVDPLNPKGALR